VESTTRALAKLYEMFDVAPVPRRRTHDGKSRIEVESKDWHDQHEELWKLLVPGKGPAATVQGEVIRITGRISNEILGNGAVNWDSGYKMMARALCEHLRSGVPLPDDQLRDCEDIVGTVRDRSEEEVARLAGFAVTWVLLNPMPVKLPKPNYDLIVFDVDDDQGSLSLRLKPPLRRVLWSLACRRARSGRAIADAFALFRLRPV